MAKNKNKFLKSKEVKALAIVGAVGFGIWYALKSGWFSGWGNGNSRKDTDNGGTNNGGGTNTNSNTNSDQKQYLDLVKHMFDSVMETYGGTGKGTSINDNGGERPEWIQTLVDSYGGGSVGLVKATADLFNAAAYNNVQNINDLTFKQFENWVNANRPKAKNAQ